MIKSNNQNNIKDTKGWKMETEKLTEEQKQIVESVGFPNVIKNAFCLQKRIKKHYANGSYIENRYPELEDIKYIPVSRNIAEKAVLRLTPADKRQEEFLQRTARTRNFQSVYLSGSAIGEELERLFSRYGKPAPTENMIEAPTAKKEAPKQKKGLSNVHKSKVLEMAENGSSADEISKAIGKEKSLVIEYLKKANEK